jgi:hypothetical protein
MIRQVGFNRKLRPRFVRVGAASCLPGRTAAPGMQPIAGDQ